MRTATHSPRLSVFRLLAKATVAVSVMALVVACSPEARGPSVGQGGEGGGANDVDAGSQGGSGGAAGGSGGAAGGSGGGAGAQGGNAGAQGGGAGAGGTTLPDAGMPDAAPAKPDAMAMAPVVLDVIADVNSRKGMPDTNLGLAPELGVKDSGDDLNRNGFLKFSLAALQAVQSVSAAKLRLMVTKGSQTELVELQVRELADDNWSETTLTWNTQPAAGALLVSAPISSMTYVPIDFDVTAYVRTARQAQRTNLSFALTGTMVSEVQMKVASRENGAVKGAQLVVTP